MSETFRATIQQTGKTTCGIEVPEAVITGLGGSKRPAVVVTLDHYTKDQYAETKSISRDELQPGDLVFFQNTY